MRFLNDVEMTAEEKAEWDALIADYKAKMRLPAAMPVKIQPTVTLFPAIDPATYKLREHAANMGMPSTRKNLLGLYAQAMRDEGKGLSFMTPAERRLASDEWSRQLAALVAKSDAEAKRKERLQVVCDGDWLDD